MKEGTYIRVSGTKRPADRDTIAEMYYECSGKSYDCAACMDRDISREEIALFCGELKQIALLNCGDDVQRSRVRDVTENKLIEWGVITEDEEGIRPTNAYVFLKGLDNFHSIIQCAVFKGVTRGIFVDKRDYGGTLWEQVDAAYQFVLRNIHLGGKIEGIYRHDVYELPPSCIRELIINAAVHCSFLQPSRIQVAVFDNRVEITSPGGLMPDVTVEKMKAGYSKIRNRAIANVFAYMNMIESWGSGIPKIIRELEEYGLPEPEIIDMGGALRVNMYREDYVYPAAREIPCVREEKSFYGVTEKVTEDLTWREWQILNLLCESPGSTYRDLSQKAGVSRKTISKNIASLKEKKKIRRIGSDTKGYWKVLDNVKDV